MKVGVLALQGAFSKHLQMLSLLGVDGFEVRRPRELELCDALIIPGGESTTMRHQIAFIEMEEPLKQFEKPILGTCAGTILLSNQGFGLIDIDVERNGFGRQVESFSAPLDASSFPAIFIRAPRIIRVGEGVEVLGRLDGEPVYVKQGNRIATTFHPELTQDPSIHRKFWDETSD